MFVVVRFSFPISKPYRLFKFNHFAGARLLVNLHPIHIDSSDASFLGIGPVHLKWPLGGAVVYEA